MPIQELVREDSHREKIFDDKLEKEICIEPKDCKPDNYRKNHPEPAPNSVFDMVRKTPTRVFYL